MEHQSFSDPRVDTRSISAKEQEAALQLARTVRKESFRFRLVLRPQQELMGQMNKEICGKWICHTRQMRLIEEAEMPRLKAIEVNLNVPLLGGVKGTWEPTRQERDAAWELYVELITRISVVELKSGEGILREALDSLYSLFGTTREILRKYGPAIAKPRKKNEYSFGELSVIILNYVLRPLLSKWHPLLQDYESEKGKDISMQEHEDRWEFDQELREALDETRKVLISYSNYLAEVAKIKPLYKGK